MRERDDGNEELVMWLLPLMGQDDSKRILTDKEVSSLKEGTQVELGVSLSKAPSSTIQVSITSSDPSIVINDNTSTTLEFTPQNSSLEQTIILKAVEDTNKIDENPTISLSADGYETLSIPIEVTDNDNTFILATNSPATLEEGKSATFQVKLSIQPKENAIVKILSSDSSALQVELSQVEFSPENYSIEQTVNISAPEDADSTSENIYIFLSTNGSQNVELLIQIIDDEIRPIFSVPEISINEEETKTVGVSLSNDPGMSVDVYLQSTNTQSLNTNHQQLSFNSSNWNITQFIELTAPHEDNYENKSILLSAGGSGIATSYLPVEIIDDEVQEIIIAGATLSWTVNLSP